MAERVLRPRALNRAVLARQHLLERSAGSIPRVLEQVGGLQMQYAPSGYIGLWSRMRNFKRQALTDALNKRTVIQASLMRDTIHLVSRADYWLFAAGIHASRRAWWLRSAQTPPEGVDIAAAAAWVRSALEDGPRRHKDLVAGLVEAGFPRVAWAGAGVEIDLVRVPPSGTWDRRRADLYALAEQWVGPSDATEEQGLIRLATRYLRAFGPASLADLANWAGVAVPVIAPAVERLALRRFRDEQDQELLDVRGAPLPDPDQPAPVRFLPTWDAILLAHARRAGILRPEHRQHVFSTKMPQSIPTFLVDGTVAGTWRSEGGRIDLTYFEPLPVRITRQVEDEAQRLASFYDVGE